VSVRKDGSFRYDGHWRWVQRAVLARDGYVCQVRGPGCGRRADEVDHVIPTGAGGLLYDEGNCRAVCGACNRSRVNRQRQRRVPPSRDW
jgi:5-methylcytosine-specific restriction enzyme A